MSIATELTKLQARRDSIVTAINDKGGTCASGASLAECATAIANIPSGGDSYYDDYGKYMQQINKQVADGILWFERDSIDHEVQWYEGNTLVSSETDFAGELVIKKTFTTATNVRFGSSSGGLASNAYITKIHAVPDPYVTNGTYWCGFTICTEFPILYQDRESGYSYKNNPCITKFIGIGKTNSYYQWWHSCTNLKECDLRYIIGCNINLSVFSHGIINPPILRLGKDFFGNYGTYNFSFKSNWTHDSLYESLYTNQLGRDTTAYVTISLSSTDKAKLSDEEKANIASLGITIS